MIRSEIDVCGTKVVHLTDAPDGDPVELHIDTDGDLCFEWQHRMNELYLRPEDVRDALIALGVIPDGGAMAVRFLAGVRAPDPSARVRTAWRDHARKDDTEGAQIAQHAAKRRREAELTRQRAVKAAGPRYYRDRDGDVWRGHADGRLTFHRLGRSTVVSDEPFWQPRRRIEAMHGPLTDATAAENGRRDAEKAAIFAHVYGARSGQVPARFRDRLDRVWEAHPLHPDRVRQRGMRTYLGRASVDRVIGPLRPTEDDAELARIRTALRDDLNRSVWRRAFQ